MRGSRRGSTASCRTCACRRGPPAHAGRRWLQQSSSEGRRTRRSRLSSCATGSSARWRSCLRAVGCLSPRIICRACNTRRSRRGWTFRSDCEDAPPPCEAPLTRADVMTCDDVLDRVDAIASGDEPETGELRVHLAGCGPCAAALTAARELESLLAARAVASPPESFTQAVLVRMRRERWRAEQRVDQLFNMVMIAAGLLVAAGIGVLFNVG